MSSVLIVEDERVLRNRLRDFLLGRGLDVRAAATLEEARQRLGGETFDGAFLDVFLPDGSGLDLLDRVGPRRAIVMSGQPDSAAFERKGVVHRMDKPFDLQHAAELIDAVLRQES